MTLNESLVQKKNPGAPPEKKAAKVDLSPLFLPRVLPMPNREAVSYVYVCTYCLSLFTDMGSNMKLTVCFVIIPIE